jgi:cell division protein FtsI/penicillin-binding protein 2
VKEGTGQRAAASSFEILGKTGTSDAEKSAYKTDGWFLGAYPAGHPRYAVLVFLRHAHGFEEAATLAGKIFSLGFQTGFFEIKN